jgi:hypothetical protein
MLPQGSFEKRADAALIFDNQYFHSPSPKIETFPFLSYQIVTRRSGGKYILSPSLTPNAA